MAASTTPHLPLSLALRLNAKHQGALLVLSATLGLALKGIWARLAYAEGLDVGGVLFYRSLFSAPLVVLSTWWLLRRGQSAPADPLQFKDYLPGCLLGAMFSVGMVCDFQAIAQLGAGVSRVVLFGFPLVVMLLEGVRKRRLPARHRLVGFACAWLGLAAVATPSGASVTRFGHDGLSPLAWGLASMTLYAFYVWLSGDLSRKLGSVRLTSSSNLTTAGVVVSVSLLMRQGVLPPAGTQALFWVGVMVVVSTVVPYFLMMEGVRRLGSEDASLLAMTGPVLTVVAGWFLLGESLSLSQCLGTGATLLGVGIAQGRVSFSR